jgi:hypothetical protein
MTTTITPTIEITAHSTPGGKLAINASSGDLTSRKYCVGGYPYYVISARRTEWTWSPKLRELVREPSVSINVEKRSTRREYAEREMRRNPGSVMFARFGDGNYHIVERSI